MIPEMRRLIPRLRSRLIVSRPRRRAAARVWVERLEDRRLRNGADLIPSFGSGGVVTTTFPGTSRAEASDVVVQPNGQIVVVGTGNTPDGGDFALARYNAQGTLDHSFGTGGQVLTPFPGTGGAVARSAVLEPDGKVLVAGDAFPAGSSSVSGIALARYNANGALDQLFGDHGLIVNPVGAFVSGVTLDGQGRILIWGQGVQGNSIVARFDADGQLDQSFGVGGVANSGLFESRSDSSPRSIAVQLDGQIVVAGTIYDAAIRSDEFALERYNSDGTPDATFATDGIASADLGGVTDSARGLAIQPDGKIVVFGSTFAGLANPNFNSIFGLARFDSNGRLDRRFGTRGITIDPSSVGSPIGIAIEPDGKIVLVGNQTHYGPSYDPYSDYDSVTLSRYDADGLLDTTFGAGGTTTPWTSPQGNDASAVAFAPDGTFVVAGIANTGYGQTPTFLVARFRGLDLDVAAPTVGVRGQAVSFSGTFEDQSGAQVFFAPGTLATGRRRSHFRP